MYQDLRITIFYTIIGTNERFFRFTHHSLTKNGYEFLTKKNE